MPEHEHITVERDGPIAIVSLDRPGKLNALTIGMLADIEQVAERIAGSDARAVVLQGNGPSFCAGMDIGTFTSGVLYETDADVRYDAAKLGSVAADAIESLPQVTVAALHGHVVGGGLVLAAACDLRVAEEDATFSIPEIDLGIPLAWGGISRLVREFGPARTKDFVMTARSFGASEAAEAGFVSRTCATGEATGTALELARTIASKARFPITTTKRHVAEILDGDDTRDDAVGLLAAIEDPESIAARDRYLKGLGDG